MESAEERRAVAEAGARWARNILGEILTDHARVLSPAKTEALKEAVLSLGDFFVADSEES
jgi:hypothetical protein